MKNGKQELLSYESIRSEQGACWVSCKESGGFTACIKTGASVRPVLKGPDYGKRRYRSGN